MSTRRTLLAAAIAAPLLARLRGRAQADRRAPAVGAVFAGRRRLRVRHAHVFSIANANDRYLAYLELRDRLGDEMGSSWLQAPGGAVRWAGSFGDRTATFELDRDQAIALAAVWGVEVRDRVPLGAALVGHWRARDHHSALGDPIAIELDVENPGPTPAYVSVGGRQRGPRDNRFAFTAIDPAGAAAAPITADDFGGPMTYAIITPDQPVHVATELQRYVTIDRGGVYAVTCRYQAELVAAPSGSGWPEHAHETWDLELTGHVDVRVE